LVSGCVFILSVGLGSILTVCAYFFTHSLRLQ
jgi:hypothetical protein